MLAALVLGALLALALPKAPPQSRPARVSVTLGEPAPQTLPGARALAAAFPEVAALPSEQQRAVALGLARVSAPCAPCAERALSACVLSPPPGCENLPGLVRRAAAVAEGGEGSVAAHLAYGDVWIPGVAPEEWEGAVPVELWLDLASPLLGRALDAVDALRSAAPLALTIRLAVPASRSEAGRALARLGFAAGEERVGELGRCVAAARERGGEATTWATTGALSEAALVELGQVPACAGLDLRRLDAVGRAATVSKQLAAEQADAEARGVRSGPTWFINGYRMRGLQSLDALSQAIAREAADKRSQASPAR